MTDLQLIEGHFRKYHNTLCLSTKISHKYCFQFLFGLSMVPRDNKNNAYAKFGETNKEYYGIFQNGLLLCTLQVVFTLRHSCHVGGLKQQISNQLLLFVHQQLYIAALLSVSLDIGCKPPTSFVHQHHLIIALFKIFFLPFFMAGLKDLSFASLFHRLT